MVKTITKIAKVKIIILTMMMLCMVTELYVAKITLRLLLSNGLKITLCLLFSLRKGVNFLVNFLLKIQRANKILETK